LCHLSIHSHGLKAGIIQQILLRFGIVVTVKSSLSKLQFGSQ
jgi:hypothetical protein